MLPQLNKKDYTTVLTVSQHHMKPAFHAVKLGNRKRKIPRLNSLKGGKLNSLPEKPPETKHTSLRERKVVTGGLVVGEPKLTSRA